METTESKPLNFDEAYREEWKEIRTRRASHFYLEASANNGVSSPENLTGLALSGGGIRSATLCLGLLQGMHKLKLLRVFDYLSTVSGGGYIGGWWSAWLARNDVYPRTKDKNNIPLIMEHDIKNVSSLAVKLHDQRDPTSKNLFKRFTPATRTELAKYKDGDQPPQELKHVLAAELRQAQTPQFCKAGDLKQYLRCFFGGAKITVKNRTGANTAEENKRAAEEKKRKETTEKIFKLLSLIFQDRDTFRWLNRLLLEEAYPYELKDIFPTREQIEPVRWKQIERERSRSKAPNDKQKETEGSLCAWEDPIHHLRLFANYLTPRRGALSADTWRAVSTITRNLTLTWLILIPILIAVVLLGQAYFMLWLTPESFLLAPDNTKIFRAIVIPLAFILGALIVLAFAWLSCNRDSTSSPDVIIQYICLSALVLLVGAGVNIYYDLLPAMIFKWKFIVCGLLAFGLWAFMVFWRPGSKGAAPAVDPGLNAQWVREMRRNRISRWQTRFQILFAALAVVLFISGFSGYLLKMIGSESGSMGGKYFTIPLGLLPVVSAVAGSIFTALKSTPTGGGDKRDTREPSAISRFIFAVTPILVILVLTISVALAGNILLTYIWDQLSPDAFTQHFNSMARSGNFLLTSVGSQLGNETFSQKFNFLLCVAALFGVLLCLALAVNEIKLPIKPSVALIPFIVWLIFLASWGGFSLYSFLHVTSENIGSGDMLFGFAIFFALALSLMAFLKFVVKGKWKKNLQGRHWVLSLLSVPLIVASGVFLAREWRRGSANVLLSPKAVPLVLAGLAFSLIIFRFGVKRSKENLPFKLKWFNNSKWGRKPESLSIYASICLMVPVAIICWMHALLACHGLKKEGANQIALFVLPLIVAPLPEVLILLYRIVNKKGVETADTPPVEGVVGKRNFISGLIKGFRGNLRQSRENAAGTLAVVALVAALSLGFATKPLANKIGIVPQSLTTLPDWLALVVAFAASFAVFKFVLTRQPFWAKAEAADNTIEGQFLASKPYLILILAGIALTISVGYLIHFVSPHIVSEVSLESSPLAAAVLPGMAACLTLIVAEMRWGESENRHSLSLIAATYFALLLLFLLTIWPTLFPNATFIPTLRSVLGLLAVALVWVVALGWMVDPNAVSMHQFYKARLVRAYLGASNIRRRTQGKDITEAAAGDDLPLSMVKTCQRGGPYHLINTTLNLVAGRDLATAQRSATNFVLSSNYCGSLRTAYRPTSEYMNGLLSLGTAVAASGAAVSPSMGAKKPTAALAMLLTLLNVRLGYWSPTPNRENWMSPQPKLWPFYLMREFLSQTNDVSSYCYLTDGGHFDNTGLYALVERGCRFIVLVDCAADPEPPCFQDLGDAIRRCRIDFGTEIKLDLDPLAKATAKNGIQPFIVGGIRYSQKHAKTLGWYTQERMKELGWDRLPEEYSQEDKEYRSGKIIYFKPSISGKETADVRQYALENDDFPQQATTNQWFDEAQFESYRRLGQHCAKLAFEELEAVRRIQFKAKLSPDDIRAVFEEIADKESIPKPQAPWESVADWKSRTTRTA